MSIAFPSSTKSTIQAIIAVMIANIIHLVFLSYTVLLFARIVGSWFPAIAGHAAMGYVRQYTDPYLNLFRRIIPPIGGTFDLSPMLAYIVLQIAENVLLMIFR
jgi:YggT family protein